VILENIKKTLNIFVPRALHIFFSKKLFLGNKNKKEFNIFFLTCITTILGFEKKKHYA